MDVDHARPGAGRTLNDRYELIEKLGAGGMAEVWRAHDDKLGRDVAVKILPGVAAQDPTRRNRIAREARALASLNHPNVVAVYDYGEETVDEGVVPYIVMELVDGTDLHRYLAEQGALPVAEAVALMDGVLAGIERAHSSGVVHGDLKPANVFIGPHGPKVGDFGVARILDQETGTTTVAATPTFAAPEVLRGERPTAASDVYSAGCVLFEMLTGRAPFVGANGWDVAQQHMSNSAPHPQKLRQEVPRELDAAVVRSMAKVPHDRFPTAESFGNAIRDTASDAGATVRVVPPVPSAAGPSTEVIGRPQIDPARIALFGPFAGWWDRIRRHPALIAIAAGLLILIAALLIHDEKPATVAVPDVRGKDVAVAAASLRLKGFKVEVSYKVSTDPTSRVLEEVPAVNTQVAPGAVIHLIASAHAAETPKPTVAPSKASTPRTPRKPGHGRKKGKD